MKDVYLIIAKFWYDKKDMTVNEKSDFRKELKSQIDDNDLSYDNAVILRYNNIRSYKKDNGNYKI